MSENLSWSLSEGAPDVKTLDGKDEQRPPETPPDMPQNLPAQFRSAGGGEPGDEINWHELPDPPDLDVELDAEAWEREREEARQVAEAERDYIEQGIEPDPLAGAAERGGYHAE